MCIRDRPVAELAAKDSALFMWATFPQLPEALRPVSYTHLFEAYITNLGKYNEGRLVGETLKFPATTEEVQALLTSQFRHSCYIYPKYPSKQYGNFRRPWTGYVHLSLIHI